jgi:hypothetical protein
VAAAVITGLILAGGPAAIAQADPGTTGWERYVTTYQGKDRATFDRVEGDFKVCDNEKDGRRVYVYFSNDPYLYYDTTSGGCTTFGGTWYPSSGAMYVCEEIAGWWDACSDGVEL